MTIGEPWSKTCVFYSQYTCWLASVECSPVFNDGIQENSPSQFSHMFDHCQPFSSHHFLTLNHFLCQSLKSDLHSNVNWWIMGSLAVQGPCTVELTLTPALALWSKLPCRQVGVLLQSFFMMPWTSYLHKLCQATSTPSLGLRSFLIPHTSCMHSSHLAKTIQVDATWSLMHTGHARAGSNKEVDRHACRCSSLLPRS